MSEQRPPFRAQASPGADVLLVSDTATTGDRRSWSYRPGQDAFALSRFRDGAKLCRADVRGRGSDLIGGNQMSVPVG